MIDVENEIVDKIIIELRSRFPGIDVSSEGIRSPSSYPCVSIVEADNYTLRKTQDSGNNENHAVLMYEVNVYTNKTTGKKTECKAIFSVVDDVFLNLGFTRLAKHPVTMHEATISRMVGRYKAVVSKTQIVYGR